MSKASEIALSILIGAKMQSSFSNAIKKAQSGMQTMAKTSGTAVKAFGSMTAAAASATVATGAYLLNLGKNFDEVADSIRIGTGATGDALNSLLSDFDAVYSSVPTTMDNASKAIADYNTRLGLSGKALQNISTQAIQVSDMLSEDLGNVIESSSQAIQIWNIDAENMTSAMDYVFKASQSTGVGFSDLMSNVQQFAPQLKELGYGFNESVSLIGQMEKAGVNTTEVLSAMKKSVSTLAKDGLSASKGMELYTEKIKNAKTMTEATSLASEIFGTRAASTMAAAIRDGTVDVASLTKELSLNSETISGCAEDTYDFTERLQMFKNNAEVALKPFANSVFDSMNELMPVASDLLNSLMPQIQNLATVMTPILGDVVDTLIPVLVSSVSEIIPILDSILPLGADIIVMLMDGIEEILPFVSQLITTLMPCISTILPLIMKSVQQILPCISALLPVIMQLVSAVMPIITDVITVLLPPLTTIVTSLLPVIMQIIQALIPLINVLSPIIYMLANAFGEALMQGLQMIMPIIQNIMGVFQGLIDFITGIFTGNWQQAWEGIKEIFGNAFGALGGIVKMPINAVIGIINSAIAGINSIAIEIPDWVPGLGGKTYGFNIQQIPMLANGGIVTAPTISMIGEGSEPEAVIPLSKLEKMLSGDFHSSGSTYEIVYSPIYQIMGNASKEDIADVTADDFERFKQFMKQYEKEKRRVKL